MQDRPLDPSKSRFRPGKGLHFESADGDFALTTRLRAQFLYSAIHEEEWLQSFQIRRARLQFGGTMFGPANQFKVELAVSPRDVGLRESVVTTSPLLDWYMQFNQLRDLTLRIGQYKVPHNRQRVVSSGDLRMVDRSIVNAEFTLDRDLGLDIRSDDFLGLGLLRYYLGIYVGEGRNTGVTADFGMMYLARVEVLPLGDFDDYSEADLERSSTAKLSIGLGYGRIVNATHEGGIIGDTFADGGTSDSDHLTADAVFRLSGLSVETEVMWRDGEREAGDAVDEDGDPIPEVPPRNGIGGMLQAGYLLPFDLELVARGSIVRGAGDSALGDANEYGAGVNYYFAGHPFKLQADFFRLGRRPVGAEWSWSSLLRVQLQVSL